MVYVEDKFTIDAQADKVWETVSGFDKVEQYIPLMKNTVLEGSGVGATRVIESVMPDGSINTIKERLEFIDESQKMLQFIVLETLMPFEKCIVTIKVTPLENNKTEFYTNVSMNVKGMSDDEIKALCLNLFKMEAEGLEKLHHN